MQVILNDLDGWFYSPIENPYRTGNYAVLTKCNIMNGGDYTHQIKIIRLNSENIPADVFLHIDGIINAYMCQCSVDGYLFCYDTQNMKRVYISSFTDKVLIKSRKCGCIPCGDSFLLIDRQGNTFDYRATNYEYYDMSLNLLWSTSCQERVIDSAYRIYKAYIELGDTDKIYLTKNSGKLLSDIPNDLDLPIYESEWYLNEKNSRFLSQLRTNINSSVHVSNSLFNDKEYVITYYDEKQKCHIVKLDAQCHLIWDNQIPLYRGEIQTLCANDRYYVLGSVSDRTFLVTTVNRNGNIEDISQEIAGEEFYGYVCNDKLVIFLNRFDNLKREEKKLYNNGVLIANGYYAIVG